MTSQKAQLERMHKLLVRSTITNIIQQMELAGGGFPHSMTVLQEVIVGVVAYYVKTGGDEAVLQEMFAGVTHQLTEARLKGMQRAQVTAE